MLLAAGANDILAITFHLSINAITRVLPVSIFVIPPISYVVTKRICLGLQRRDRDLVLHGRETGASSGCRTASSSRCTSRSPRPIFALTQHESPHPLELEPATDANGIPRRRILASKIRARVSRFYFEDTVSPPTPAEVRELEGHH